jgi:hypothetical protein
MKHFLFENDGIDDENRKILEVWYAKERGKRVPYSDILHELQAEKVASISHMKS